MNGVKLFFFAYVFNLIKNIKYVISRINVVDLNTVLSQIL